MAELFPYLPRQNQNEIMQEITDAIRHKRQFIFESGTGSGKTICVLAAALTYALDNHKKIIYTTRTNAQQQQVIHEMRAIQKKSQEKRIYGVGMQGRGNMCLLARENPEIQNGNAEELSRFCSYQKNSQSQRKEMDAATIRISLVKKTALKQSCSGHRNTSQPQKNSPTPAKNKHSAPTRLINSWSMMPLSS